MLTKIEKSYDSNNPYKGIIDYITTKTESANINKDDYLKPHSSSVSIGTELLPIGIGFPDTETYFATNPNIDEWYSLDFVSSCVRMKSFVMANYGRDYPKLLRVEVSNDGIVWKSIQDIEIPEYNYNDYFRLNFNISNPVTSRMIRFKNKGERYMNDNHLIIYRIEIFGEFIYQIAVIISKNNAKHI